MREMNGEI